MTTTINRLIAFYGAFGIEWQKEEDFLLSQYNQAYDAYVHAPEDEAHKYKKELEYWRKKWLNH